VVNKAAGEKDTLIADAGGIPGEIAAGWSCAMAQSGPGSLGGTLIVMLDDGAYMMMNSDIYSTVMSGQKMIVVVCNTGGYAVISRLQQFKGVPGFNNLLKDCRITDKANPLHVDFAKWAPQTAPAPAWRKVKACCW
jgi:3D-(3,5/4)-trihydroxycyclohexane-1,2-dione acylhydrolase (decyclizing)